MHDIARLSFKGGGVILPAGTSYERELLVAHVEASARRHGPIQLEVNGRCWTIDVNDGLRPACDACSQWPEALAYPGRATGAFSVVSSRATPCTPLTCELARLAVTDGDGGSRLRAGWTRGAHRARSIAHAATS